MKNAILFGGTDGHGVTMTAITQKNLQAAGYQVRTVCRFPGTFFPGQFWGETFLNENYCDVALVVIVDIPLPEPDGTFPNAIRDGLAKVMEISRAGTEVVIVDHHKATETHYGEARAAGAAITITSSATSCYWGVPSEFASRWGRLGAICDLDDSVLPVVPEEESIAAQLDAAVRKDLSGALEAILRDDLDWFNQFGGVPEIPGAIERLGEVVLATEITPQWGFKQLSRLVAEAGATYAIGVDCYNRMHRVIAITDWKSDSLPVALKLGLTRFIGHGSAILVPVCSAETPNGRELALAKAREFAVKLGASEPHSIEEAAAVSGNAADNLFKYVSQFMRSVEIPFFLTQHGWPHVQRVVANCRTLGSLFNLSEADRRVLDWVALFHDVGNGANTYYPELGLSDEHARKAHHEYSRQMVVEWWRKGLFKGILTDGEVARVADLSFRHRKKVALPEDAHERMVCTIFRVADGIDIDARRAQRNDAGAFFDDIDLPEESIQHWEGHRAIESMRIAVDGQQLVFEFIVTNSEKAAFQVHEVQGELACLTAYCNWTVRVLRADGKTAIFGD